MFSTSKLSSLLLLLPSALAVPSPATTDLAVRSPGTTFCGQFDTDIDGNYELFLDQFGLSDATSGSDCASITSLDGNTVAWTTTWEWVGGTSVKSFTNMQLNEGVNQQLSAISSITSSWFWTIDFDETPVCDVAYDLFTADTAGGEATNEIMIWLANFQSGPISFVFNAEGQAVPIASDISVAGFTWNLYSGTNGANAVWSFLTTEDSITGFSNVDIMDFFNYLIDNEGLSSSQFLITFQTGTEATSGAATLTTTSYTTVIS